MEIKFATSSQRNTDYLHLPSFKTLLTFRFSLQVAKLANFIEPVADAAINAASKMPHSKKQTDLLDQTKTVAESATELLYAVKDAGGNPKVTKFVFEYPQFDTKCHQL